MNDIASIKIKIMEEIEKASPIFLRSSAVQYRIRCPICGDSIKNPNVTHMYLKCDFTTNEPILYYCFKANCNAHGNVNSEFLKKMGIVVDGIELLENSTYNKLKSMKTVDIDILTDDVIMDSNQVKYIEYRLGEGFTYDDYKKFRIIWNMENIASRLSNERVIQRLPNCNNTISFISDNKSYLITRTFAKDNGWMKIKLFDYGNIYYMIESSFNLFTADDVYINIAEGVFDILSVYKNFNTGDNSAYIASLGSDYISALKYIISKGLVGKNFHINIYIDSEINKKTLIWNLRKYRWIFGRMKIFENIKYKDVGVTIDKIKLVETNV